MKTDTKVAHTPTPWSISGITGDHHLMARCRDGQRRTVAIFVGWPGITEDELDANKILAQSAINNRAALVQSLQLLLDSVDYTSGACSVNEMVGAVLPKEIIKQAKDALHLAKGEAL